MWLIGVGLKTNLYIYYAYDSVLGNRQKNPAYIYAYILYTIIQYIVYADVGQVKTHSSLQCNIHIYFGKGFFSLN